MIEFTISVVEERILSIRIFRKGRFVLLQPA